MLNTFQEAADKIGVSLKMIYYYTNNKQLQVTNKRTLRFIRDKHIDDFMELYRRNKQKRGVKPKLSKAEL